MAQMGMMPFLNYDYPRPRRQKHNRLLDQDFGQVLTAEDLLTMAATPIKSEYYYRPWRCQVPPIKDIGSNIRVDKEKFQVYLEMQHFAPDEISVKTVDGHLVVEAKHKEKEDEHGYVGRELLRRYVLPEGIMPESVEARLSSDGVLYITAPKKPPEVLKGERVVPITEVGPMRKDVKDPNQCTEDKKKKTPN